MALSRARNLEGLQIDAFDATRIYAHSRVKEFYQGLSSTVDELAHSGYLVQSSSTRVDSKCKMEPSPGIALGTNFLIAMSIELFCCGSLNRLTKPGY